MDAAIAEKNFSWSYSKLTGFEICPRRYHEVTVKKAWPEEDSEQLRWGDEVHTAMAHALRTGTPLPTKFKIFQHWIDKVNATEGEMLVESDCQWAINHQFRPTAWFAKNVWLRCIADVVKLNEDYALVVDWKTGKSKNADPVQLKLTSLMMFIQFPQLRAVRSDFVWLTEDDCTIQSLYRNEVADAWSEILPRVNKLERATALENFPPIYSRFCKSWCPVKSCEFWGK